MKWGAVVRGESRGLGNLAAEVYRNMRPDRSLLIEMGDLARGFPIVHEYPDAVRVPFVGGTLDETVCRDWLAGLDVVLMLETAYDHRFIDWARDAGCATVLYAMPEFLVHHGDHGIHTPTRFWNPTRWRQEHMPPGTVVVPMPVALDRFTSTAEPHDGPLRVLHVAGHRAAHDRNGTTMMLMATRRLRNPTVVTITGQDGRLPKTSTPRGIQLRVAPHSVANYWDLYDGYDLMVMPRRFGGLCLPVQEAMGAGLPVLMTDCAPNRDWPVHPVASTPHGTIRTAAGDIDMYAVNAGALATTIDWLNADRGSLADLAAGSRQWAADHSWDALREIWLTELASAALAGRVT